MQKPATSLWSQLVSARSTAEIYRQRLPEFTEPNKAEIADGFDGFLYDFFEKYESVVEKQPKSIELTAETDLEAVNTFLRGLYYKPSRHGSSF